MELDALVEDIAAQEANKPNNDPLHMRWQLLPSIIHSTYADIQAKWSHVTQLPAYACIPWFQNEPLPIIQLCMQGFDKKSGAGLSVFDC